MVDGVDTLTWGTGTTTDSATLATKIPNPVIKVLHYLEWPNLRKSELKRESVCVPVNIKVSATSAFESRIIQIRTYHLYDLCAKLQRLTDPVDRTIGSGAAKDIDGLILERGENEYISAQI